MRQQLKRLEKRTHRDDSRLTMKSQLIAIVAAVLVVGCGKTPDTIHHAAEAGNIKAIKQHLVDGVDVNVKDARGMTPLHFATGWDHKESVELLIDADADVNAKDDEGRTPLDLATRLTSWTHIRRKRTETAALLRKHGGKTAKPSISIHKAALVGNIEAVKQHLTAGMDVDARDKQDKTPLQHAAYWGHKEIAELLIAKGADINAKDNAGTTTLVWAVLGGKKESVELLIVNGVDVNAKSNYGTPLDVAIHRKKTEIADLLRKHGGKTGEELKAEGN